MAPPGRIRVVGAGAAPGVAQRHKPLTGGTPGRRARPHPPAPGRDAGAAVLNPRAPKNIHSIRQQCTQPNFRAARPAADGPRDARPARRAPTRPRAAAHAASVPKHASHWLPGKGPCRGPRPEDGTRRRRSSESEPESERAGQARPLAGPPQPGLSGRKNRDDRPTTARRQGRPADSGPSTRPAAPAGRHSAFPGGCAGSIPRPRDPPGNCHGGLDPPPRAGPRPRTIPKPQTGTRGSPGSVPSPRRWPAARSRTSRRGGAAPTAPATTVAPAAAAQ